MKPSEILKGRLNTIRTAHDDLVKKIRESEEDWQDYTAEFRAFYNEERQLEERIKIEERRELDVGDGCTYHLYTDAEACTVIKKTPKTITIQEDTATLDPNFKPEWIAGGFAGHCTNQNEQSYTYEPNPNGRKITARWSDKRGGYVYMDKVITVGRNKFHDYNF